MLEFLLALLTTATVAALLVPLMRTRGGEGKRLDADLAIYRDQLAELERERATGALSDAEATAARTEIERRILTAADKDEKAATAGASPAFHRYLPPALCLAIPLLALGVYLQLGHPGLPSAPFVAGAHAPAAEEEKDRAALAKAIGDAKARAAEKPDDPAAQSALGEALTMEADGTVTEPAVRAFTSALSRNPDDARALYYLGLHEAQAGDSAGALKRWRELEARSPAGAPWLPMLRAAISRLSGGPPQPSQDQMVAMEKLSPEERQQAIRGMVDGLAARLANQPDDREGWLRLANARKVLGDNDKAADAFAKADALKPIDGTKQLADWAEALVRQIPAGGAPSPETKAVLLRLDKADPGNPLAAFYLGVAAFAEGDKAEASRRWKELLARLPPDAPIRGMLQKKIEETGQ